MSRPPEIGRGSSSPGTKKKKRRRRRQYRGAEQGEIRAIKRKPEARDEGRGAEKKIRKKAGQGGEKTRETRENDRDAVV
jgi:hypothetical protein